MKELMIYTLETLVCSGVLLGMYSLLLDRRVRFGWCRAYLPLSIAAAAVIPLLRIPVWSAQAPAAVAVGMPTFEIAPQKEVAAALVTPEFICAVVYALGTLLILGSMLRQALHIRRLRHGAETDRMGRITLVRTSQRIAAFSFFRSIYVWAGTPDEELAAVVAHETSHIDHRHSVERIAMELLKAALWWNPFAWIAARKLTEAQEYEADRDVLRSGYDLNNYMTTLFTQLFGYSPDIANGLRTSLTKKRFQMMTSHTNGRYSLLRMLGTVPAIAGLLCAFAFTTRAAEPIAQNNADQIKVVNAGRISDFSSAPQIVETLRNAEPSAQAAASAEPLFILNGTEVTNDFFKTLNPDCIENISVYKKPEAVQRFGDRAANGVVEITTKSGKVVQFTPEEMAKRQDVEIIRVVSEPKSDSNSDALQVIGTTTESTAKNLPDPFVVVENMPQFQGGTINDFRNWTSGQIRYPEEAVKRGIMGRVVLSFVVETDGTVNFEQVLQSPDPLLTKEAERIVRASSGLWTPGTQRGQKVRVKYTFPVDFALKNAETPAAEIGK